MKKGLKTKFAAALIAATGASGCLFVIDNSDEGKDRALVSVECTDKDGVTTPYLATEVVKHKDEVDIFDEGALLATRKVAECKFSVLK